MKTRIFVLAILATVLLAACGGTPIADQVIKDVIDPPALPTLGEPIQLAVGQPVEIAHDETTLTLENLGKDESGQYQWTCVDDQDQSCAERHGNEADMVFYHEFKLVGATLGDSFMLTSDWEVKLDP